MSKLQETLARLVEEGKLDASDAVDIAKSETERRDNVRVQPTGNITVAGIPGLARFGLTSNIVGWVGVMRALGVDPSETVLRSLIEDNLDSVRNQQASFIAEGKTQKARENRAKNATDAFAALGLTLSE